MARRPKLRASFYDDAQFLMRLGKAVLDDASLPRNWRNDIEHRCRQLAADLMQAPSRTECAAEPVPSEAKPA